MLKFFTNNRWSVRSARSPKPPATWAASRAWQIYPNTLLTLVPSLGNPEHPAWGRTKTHVFTNDNSKFVPIVFCLLPNKRASTYKIIFESLNRCIKKGPETFLINFGSKNRIWNPVSRNCRKGLLSPSCLQHSEEGEEEGRTSRSKK